MINSLQTQTNELRQMVFDDLARGQNKIFEGLVDNVPVNRLPENIFRDYFLAGFLGTHRNPNWVAEWISIAGTPSTEVAIVDIAGNELFRVPAMIASMSLTLQGKARASIADIFTHAGNIKKNSPTQAMAFMRSALGERAQELGQETARQAVDRRWSEIFARYGVLPAQTQPQASQPNNSGDDLFDFS